MQIDEPPLNSAFQINFWPWYPMTVVLSKVCLSLPYEKFVFRLKYSFLAIDS